MFSESDLLSTPEQRQAGAWSVDRRRSSVTYSARTLGLELPDLEIRRPTLEDVYLALVDERT